MKTARFLASAFLLLFLSATVKAQDNDWEVDESGNRRMVVRFEISPKSLEQPVLKYSLIWKQHEQIDANAAYYYEQAYAKSQEVLAQRMKKNVESQLETIWDRAVGEKPIDRDFLRENTIAFYGQNSFDPKEKTAQERLLFEKENFLNNWRRSVYSYSRPEYFENFEENLEQAREFVRDYKDVFRLMETGSRCKNCEFGFVLLESEDIEEIWSTAFSEVQHARELARILRVKTRLEIHEKQYAEAVKSMRLGLQLARHYGEQPLLYCTLVGISIQGIVYSDLQLMMQDPQSPNLYWAVSHKPNPYFTNWVGYFEEMNYLYRVLPVLKKAMEHPEACSDQQWTILLDRMELVFRKQMEEWDESASSDDPDTKPEIPKWPDKETAWNLARIHLQKKGKNPEEIETMSREKAIGLHLVHDVSILRDEMFKSVYLPLGEEVEEDESLEKKVFNGENSITTPYALWFADWFFPSIYAGRRAYARAQLNTDVFRIAEAISLFMEENGGKIPENLDQITSVSIPRIDPFTGKAYEYRVEEGRGIIEVPRQAPSAVYYFEKKIP